MSLHYPDMKWKNKKCRSRNKVLLFQIICHENFSFSASDSMGRNFANSKPWAWKSREKARFHSSSHMKYYFPPPFECVLRTYRVKAISAGRIINWPRDLQNGYDHVIWDMYLHGHLSLFKNVMVLNMEGVFWSHQSCSLVKQYCWIDIQIYTDM